MNYKKPLYLLYMGGAVLEVYIIIVVVVVVVVILTRNKPWRGGMRMWKLGLRWLCCMPKVTQLGSNIADVLGAKVVSRFPLSTF